jgi:hypothetical protein
MAFTKSKRGRSHVRSELIRRRHPVRPRAVTPPSIRLGSRRIEHDHRGACSRQAAGVRRGGTRPAAQGQARCSLRARSTRKRKRSGHRSRHRLGPPHEILPDRRREDREPQPSPRRRRVCGRFAQAFGCLVQLSCLQSGHAARRTPLGVFRQRGPSGADDSFHQPAGRPERRLHGRRLDHASQRSDTNPFAAIAITMPLRTPPPLNKLSARHRAETVDSRGPAVT